MGFLPHISHTFAILNGLLNKNRFSLSLTTKSGPRHNLKHLLQRDSFCNPFFYVTSGVDPVMGGLIVWEIPCELLPMGPKLFRHILSCPRFGGVRWDAFKACFGRSKNSPSRLTLGLKQFGTLFLRFAKNHHQPTPMALGQSKYV